AGEHAVKTWVSFLRQVGSYNGMMQERYPRPRVYRYVVSAVTKAKLSRSRVISKPHKPQTPSITKRLLQHSRHWEREWLSADNLRGNITGPRNLQAHASRRLLHALDATLMCSGCGQTFAVN